MVSFPNLIHFSQQTSGFETPLLTFSGLPKHQIFSCGFDNLFGHRAQVVDLQNMLDLHEQAMNDAKVAACGTNSTIFLSSIAHHSRNCRDSVIPSGKMDSPKAVVNPFYLTEYELLTVRLLPGILIAGYCLWLDPLPSLRGDE